MREVWRDVPGWVGEYQASNWGRVRSLPRRVIMRNGVRRPVKGGLLKPHVGKHGYPCVSLRRPGTRITRTVHRVVALAFMGEPPAGLVVCHNDGNQLRNHTLNLRYGTPQSNHKDKYAHGTDRRGEKHPLARLTREHVLAIRASNEKGAVLAERYGVSASHVSAIRVGRFWAHLEDT